MFQKHSLSWKRGTSTVLLRWVQIINMKSRLLCSIASPDISIITNANNAHLGEFGSEENLVKAKGEILESLTKDGLALINIASPHKETWHEISGTQSLTFFGNQG